MVGSVRVIFICQGNICRSAMAEVIAKQWLDDAGLDAQISSAGISDEEHGNGIDPRAARVLLRGGYRPGPHRAHQITRAELQGADLVIAAEDYHLRALRRLDPHATNLYLVSQFDPNLDDHTPLPDPWYGPDAAFDDTLAALEAAMPAIVSAIREHSTPHN